MNAQESMMSVGKRHFSIAKIVMAFLVPTVGANIALAQNQCANVFRSVQPSFQYLNQAIEDSQGVSSAALLRRYPNLFRALEEAGDAIASPVGRMAFLSDIHPSLAHTIDINASSMSFGMETFRALLDSNQLRSEEPGAQPKLISALKSAVNRSERAAQVHLAAKKRDATKVIQSIIIGFKQTGRAGFNSTEYRELLASLTAAVPESTAGRAVFLNDLGSMYGMENLSRRIPLDGSNARFAVFLAGLIKNNLSASLVSPSGQLAIVEALNSAVTRTEDQIAQIVSTPAKIREEVSKILAERLDSNSLNLAAANRMVEIVADYGPMRWWERMHRLDSAFKNRFSAEIAQTNTNAESALNIVNALDRNGLLTKRDEQGRFVFLNYLN